MSAASPEGAEDTIVALATALGPSAIAVVRLSGPRAADILSALFRPSVPGPLRSHRARHGYVVDPASGAELDEALATLMRAPRSYTREDVVEFGCHGGSVAAAAVLEAALRQGARLARPGEFTLRAFLNGRIDLARAEAVADSIAARTEASHRLALRQLRGELSAQIEAARQAALDLLAHLEASIDFAEDDVTPPPLEWCLGQVGRARDVVRALLAGAEAGALYREGLRCALVGRPNVGKSSLLNALLRQDRAIVSAIPGTTRDTLEETVNWEGLPVVLIDTAGIRDTALSCDGGHGHLEALGVERSRRALAEADLALLVLDASLPLAEEDLAVAAALEGRRGVVLWNKIDLADAGTAPTLSQGQRGVPKEVADWPALCCSALTGAGLGALREAVLRLALGDRRDDEGMLVTNARHREALRRAAAELGAAEASLRGGLAADFVCVDLTSALACLDEITGHNVGRDLLDTIFSRFCIGK